MSQLFTFTAIKPSSMKAVGDGWALEFHFENGYGASVIEHSQSYGIELAVLVTRTGKITYDTPVTNDVIGFIEDHIELLTILHSIRDLPKRKDV
jgi:hypothetical protein